jgi:hypothetical protein
MLLAQVRSAVRRAADSLRLMTPLGRDAVKRAAYDLSEADVDALVQFADECARMLGDQMSQISLGGEPDAPVLAVVFSARQRPGVVYSYEWRLRDLDDPDDPNPLDVLLVDYLGNNIMEDLQASPGPPMWEPDAQGVVHVDVQSARYRKWPQEWQRRGRPWRDERGILRHGRSSADS